jgi:hypothetical protein
MTLKEYNNLPEGTGIIDHVSGRITSKVCQGNSNYLSCKSSL